ncbi:MAG: glycoside hydrolase family 3 C-terminal domain-containing protein [Bryobacterales bacterium]|nr:glycoside hydrolase family 3 C-terminal domain-containing protein [Bryobacterales bacterium]MBV9402041.1 glycoside hydrolase family 3 C-terminal domain-containing protein [Bryobacterales bacterium]
MAVCSRLFIVSFVITPATMFAQPYLNTQLSPEARAADLVSRLTLEEKAAQMQNAAPAIPRLGIPAYDWWNEALHGVARAGQATVFPQAIALAATWDTDLMHRVADVISTEARAKYNEAIRNNDRSRYHGLTFWSPNINIFRDPRWGRGQETYGEDPYLTGRMAVAFITGLQGNDPRYYKVAATAKHFAVHSGPEPARHQFDARVSERDLRSTYLPAFRASVVEAKVESIMCAYNSVNGEPACANTELLQKILRGEWGFKGHVVSDCGAIDDIFRGHKFKATSAEASAIAVKTGTDVTCTFTNDYKSLPEAVQKGLITEAEIDRSLQRLFVARIKLGMFDPPDRVPYSKIPYSEVDSAEHRKLALEAARKSIVLLKNDRGILPLASSVRKIAVIGPSADDQDALLGNYNGFSSKHVAPLEGIQNQFKGKAEVRFAQGSPYAEGQTGFIPASALAPGLTAEYFDNADFQGQPKLTRTEPRPDPRAEYADPGVAAIVRRQSFSVRWTGALKPARSGAYSIATSGGRIFVDDNEVGQSPLMLEAGRAYKLRIEFRGAAPGMPVRLRWSLPEAGWLAEAVDTVKESDVAIAFLGLNPNLEGEEMRVNIPGFSGGDRTDLNLPAPQQRLLKSAVETGKPVIVVLTSGSAVAANYAAEHAAALLESWYNGEEAGTAIAETLAGINNPSGRLPVTFYKGIEQLPSFEDYSMTGRTYRYFKGEPLFGFGFGLSYSNFEYKVREAVRGADNLRVTVRVKNTSTREADEVVQFYLEGENDSIRELRGFQRVHLKPGETRLVRFIVGDLPKHKVRWSVGGGQPSASVPHVVGGPL